MSFEVNLGLAARLSTRRFGGVIPTFAIDLTTYDAIFTTNENGETTASPNLSPGAASSIYEPTVENLDRFASNFNEIEKRS
jgi:hypothetical protein